jgi:ubiquinone/menaquinone biosynthesis C-methylase UbiE
MGMNNDSKIKADTDAEEFVSYYVKQSRRPEALRRYRNIYELIIKNIEGRSRPLNVVDIGCGCGEQSLAWAERGHRVHGLDVNCRFLDIAKKRALHKGFDIDYQLGSAEKLPYPDNSMDVCLAEELLEHVYNWKTCLHEFSRILRLGGIVYISTTNRLCPSQNEYNLPLYSWYPASIKRYCERRAVTIRRKWVNYATYPAVNWFTFYQLRDFLKTEKILAMDRFDVIDSSRLGLFGRLALKSIRMSPLLRWVGHVFTPYSLVLGVKQEKKGSEKRLDVE